MEVAAKILDCALVAFAERGFHGMSIPDLLRDAEVGASSFYRRFPSKEALVNVLFRREKQALQRALDDGLDRALPPRALFAELWARLAGFARRHPIAFRFLEMQDHVPYLDVESRGVEMAVLGPIYLACLQFQRDGTWRSDVRAEVVIASIWGAFVGLCKAERLGYFTLTPAMLDQGRDACWRAFATATKETADARQDEVRRPRSARAPAARSGQPRRAR